MKTGKVIGTYRWNDYIKAPSTGDISRSGSEVRAGQIVCIEHMSVTNVTTKNKMMRVGKIDAKQTKRFFKARQATNIMSAWLNGHVYLIPGDAPLCEIDSPTADDEIYMNAEGLIYRSVE